MTAVATRPDTRSREVLTRLAIAEADRLRLLILDPQQRGAWTAACELLHTDPELAAATVVALAAMVPTDVASPAVLLARLDQPDEEVST